MTCGEARELFSALVDETVTPEERGALDRHLAGCAECRAELGRFRSVVSLVRGVEPERAPVGFVDRVLARTHPAPWYRRLARRLVFPLPVKLPLGAAAAVLIGVLVSLVYRQSTELQQASRPDPIPAPAAVEAPPVSQPPAPPVSGQTPAPSAPREGAERSQDALRSAPPRSETEAKRRAPEPAAATPELAGRLVVADLAAAESALGALVSRSGGRETSRRPIPDGLEVEVEIPRARADEFARELARIGRWQAARAAESPGDPVRLRIHLVR